LIFGYFLFITGYFMQHLRNESFPGKAGHFCLLVFVAKNWFSEQLANRPPF